MKKTKQEWISEFRNVGEVTISDLIISESNKKSNSEIVNKKIKNFKESQIKQVLELSQTYSWSNETILNEILTITYASYIAMLEYRHRVWEYEYMAFARRIGELWEPFCKLPFFYPIKPLTIIDPPNFEDVQSKLKQDAIDYINSLDIEDETKKELKIYYGIPWTMVDSGGIKLSLDLHFEQNEMHYNCDFKSGFSSNEKGNTNRLLLVASIYNSLGKFEKTILFVRQPEDDNNHYLQKLKNSPYWDVYCSDDCYSAMEHFTGFNLREWLDNNMDWENDICTDFKQHLQSNDLIKHLTW